MEGTSSVLIRVAPILKPKDKDKDKDKDKEKEEAMYPHWRSLMPELSIATKAGFAMFSYGCYRGFRAEYQPPHDLIGYRVSFSFFNGIFYVFPPYGVLRLFDTMNRMDVAWNGKDPKKYPSLYSEFGGLGYNQRVL